MIYSKIHNVKYTQKKTLGLSIYKKYSHID